MVFTDNPTIIIRIGRSVAFCGSPTIQSKYLKKFINDSYQTLKLSKKECLVIEISFYARHFLIHLFKVKTKKSATLIVALNLWIIL